MLRGPQNPLGYKAEENNPARRKSLNFLINGDMRGRLWHVRIYKHTDDAKFYKVVF
jgi:hypothetical protein